MFIEVGCESCNYSFDLIFGYCGKSTFRPYRCNDCKRYFIAKIPPQFHGTKRMSLYKDIKAVAVLDEEKNETYTYSLDTVLCEECGGQNIDMLMYEDIVENDKVEVGKYTKLPCLICDSKFKCLSYGIYDEF